LPERPATDLRSVPGFAQMGRPPLHEAGRIGTEMTYGRGKMELREPQFRERLYRPVLDRR